RFMNNTHDILDDRIDVTTRGLLGLTVTCARCHDHKFDPISTKDYYALYGVFASSIEPPVKPLYDPPPTTEAYRKFEDELHKRERALQDFLQGKRQDLATSAKTRFAEYLLAVYALNGKPSTGEFMLIADGSDLNPTMIVRWQAYLARMQKAHDPVFVLWHELCSLPTAPFASQAQELLGKLTPVDPSRQINPIVLRAFKEHPPKTLAEAASRYSEVLNDVEKTWQELVKRSVELKQVEPAALPDAAQEELRQVFHGPNTPPNSALGGLNDLELLPDRPAQEKLQGFR